MAIEEGYWMRRKQRSGNVVEVSQFWYGPRRPRANRKKGSSAAEKKDRNMQQAARCMARVLNCNFSGSDYFITLTFDDKHLPENPAQAAKAVELFIKRLKRWLQKAGAAFRAVWILADKSKTGEPLRTHLHIVLGGEGIESKDCEGYLDLYIAGQNLKDIWKQGLIYSERLRPAGDYSRLAAYMTVQAVAGTDVKKYHTSRGLKKPEIISEEPLDKPQELKAPPGAVVQEVTEYDVETGTQYLRYIAPPKKARRFIGFDWSKGPAARRLLERPPDREEEI